MTKIQGAVVKEQGVTFAIVLVKRSLFLGPQSEKEKARFCFQAYFPGMPIVLMAQGHTGRPIYSGRKDLVNFLKNVHPSQIPWKEYTYA